MILIKKKIEQYLNKKGFVRPNRAIDFRGLVNNPIDALQRSGVHPCLIVVPLALCRSFGPLGLKCSPSSLNPFIQTLMQLHDGNNTDGNDLPLQKYYRKFTPENVAQLFDIKGTVSEKLLYPANTYKYPWQGYPSMELLEKRRKRYKKNNVSDSILNDQHFGPQAAENIKKHIDRLLKLKDLFEKKSYESHDFMNDEISADVLVSKNEPVYRIKNGHHRVAVLSYLGCENIEIKINSKQVYYRENSKNWMGVVENVFKEEQALVVFDNIFEGERHSVLDGIYDVN